MLSKKIQVILGLALISVGCSKQTPQKNLLSLLESKSKYENTAVRELASLGGDKCIFDVYTADTLKEEIKGLEQKFSSGKPVEGKWKHLELSKLPIAQAQFLNTFGDKLGDRNDPEAFDYSGCEDVPCVINRIYEDEKSLAGYVHYLWYLKMGNLLAPTNFVYNPRNQTAPGSYNGKTLKVSDYLYSKDELAAIWRMLKLVSEPYKKLKNLKEIYRVPRGHHFDFEEARRIREGGGPLFSQVCGEAWNTGYINMQDACLRLASDRLSGGLYENFLHELAHQIDYHEGVEKKVPKRSNLSDYLELSGFYINEYKDDEGRIIQQWKRRDGAQVPTSYGGTSPTENFAEAVAHMRVSADTMESRMTAPHREFVSSNYYNNETFTHRANIKRWLEEKEQDINLFAFQAVGGCLNSYEKKTSRYLTKSELRPWLGNDHIACLGDKSQEIEQLIIADLKINTADGCRTLLKPEDLFRGAFKGKLTGAMNKYLDEFKKDSTYFKRIEAALAEIEKTDIAREAFLSCVEPENEKQCYEDKLNQLYLAYLVQKEVPALQREELVVTHANIHKFEKIKSYVSDLYSTFAKSNISLVQSESEELFAMCVSAGVNDDLPPVGSYINVGEGYLVSSVFNCLNSSFPDAVKNIVREVKVDGEYVKHTKEEMILTKEFNDLLASSIFDKYNENKSQEKELIQTYISEDQGKVRTSLLSNFSWVSDVVDMAKLQQSCRVAALKNISFEAIYHLKSSVFSDLIDQSCSMIEHSEEYKKWLTDSSDVFETKVKSSVDSKIIQFGIAQADACIEKFPMNSSVERIKFKAERESCLIDAWPSLESKVIELMKKDEMVIKFKIDVEKFRSTLESTRRRLQLKVIKEKF